MLTHNYKIETCNFEIKSHTWAILIWNSSDVEIICSYKTKRVHFNDCNLNLPDQKIKSQLQEEKFA